VGGVEADDDLAVALSLGITDPEIVLFSSLIGCVACE
jgi:hypothetical protein